MKETEALRAALASLKDADKRANPELFCPHCERANTMRVVAAETALLRLARRGDLDTVLNLAEGVPA